MNIKERVFRNCLLFIVVAMALNLLAYQFLVKQVLYEDYILSRNQLNEFSNYLLGDSHAEVIRQQDLDFIHTTNFAFSSDSYFDVYNKLHYLVKNHKVDTVYLCVDDHTLSMYRQSWTNRYRSIYYGDYKHYGSYYNTDPVDFISKKYISFYFPFLATQHADVIKAYLWSVIQGRKPANHDNYNFSEVAVEQRIERSEARINIQYAEEEPSELLTSCLNEIIDICRSEGITLFGVKFPLTYEFVNALGDRSYNADSIFMMNSLKVYDFKDSFIDSCSYFRDQDHLNFKGSERLIEVWKKALTENRLDFGSNNWYLTQ
jgi:hypothetical protein